MKLLHSKSVNVSFSFRYRVLLLGMLSSLLEYIFIIFKAKALSVDEKLNAVCDYILEATEWAKQLRNIPKEER